MMYTYMLYKTHLDIHKLTIMQQTYCLLIHQRDLCLPKGQWICNNKCKLKM